MSRWVDSNLIKLEDEARLKEGVEAASSSQLGELKVLRRMFIKVVTDQNRTNLLPEFFKGISTIELSTLPVARGANLYDTLESHLVLQFESDRRTQNKMNEYNDQLIKYTKQLIKYTKQLIILTVVLMLIGVVTIIVTANS